MSSCRATNANTAQDPRNTLPTCAVTLPTLHGDRWVVYCGQRTNYGTSMYDTAYLIR